MLGCILGYFWDIFGFLDVFEDILEYFEIFLDVFKDFEASLGTCQGLSGGVAASLLGSFGGTLLGMFCVNIFEPWVAQPAEKGMALRIAFIESFCYCYNVNTQHLIRSNNKVANS